MRELKFRGKSKETGKWFYGNLAQHNGDVHIFPECAPDSYEKYEVIPSTVGQYTGLCDRNGLEIYEGDIVRNTFHDMTTICLWIDEHACFAFQENVQYGEHYYWQKIDEDKMKVIGNIHDNPRLLADKWDKR